MESKTSATQDDRRRRGNGGQPSKGERYAFMVRVPVELADTVITEADEAGLTRSDYIAQVLSEHLKARSQIASPDQDEAGDRQAPPVSD